MSTGKTSVQTNEAHGGVATPLCPRLRLHRSFPSSLSPPPQCSDSELRAEKDGGVSDGESKVDSGVPEVPVPPDDTPEVLNKALSGLSSR